MYTEGIIKYAVDIIRSILRTYKEYSEDIVGIF